MRMTNVVTVWDATAGRAAGALEAVIDTETQQPYD